MVANMRNSTDTSVADIKTMIRRCRCVKNLTVSIVLGTLVIRECFYQNTSASASYWFWVFASILFTLGVTNWFLNRRVVHMVRAITLGSPTDAFTTLIYIHLAKDVVRPSLIEHELAKLLTTSDPDPQIIADCNVSSMRSVLLCANETIVSGILQMVKETKSIDFIAAVRDITLGKCSVRLSRQTLDLSSKCLRVLEEEVVRVQHSKTLLRCSLGNASALLRPSTMCEPHTVLLRPADEGDNETNDVRNVVELHQD